MPTQPDLPTADATRALPETDVVLAWRNANAECSKAYEAWCSAPASAKQQAYAVYLAAADRERAAAEAL